MNSLKIWVFKQNGSWYTEDDFKIPEGVIDPYAIYDFVKENYERYTDMTLVLPMQEDWVRNGYPLMIPVDVR